MGKLWVEKVCGGGNQKLGLGHNKFEMLTSHPSRAIREALRITCGHQGRGLGCRYTSLPISSLKAMRCCRESTQNTESGDSPAEVLSALNLPTACESAVCA